MNWEILNQPLSVTIVSFFLGSVLASFISAKWQKRSQRHSVQLGLMQDTLRCYQEYMRFLRRTDTTNDDQHEFDRLHSEFVSKAKMAKVLYNLSIGNSVVYLTQRMATVYELKQQGKHEKAMEQCKEIYQLADATFEAMYHHLI